MNRTVRAVWEEVSQVKRLATCVAAALLVFPVGTAGADELPEPTVRVVSGARAPSSTNAPRTAAPRRAASIPAPRIADNAIPVAPSRAPRLDSGLPRPEVVNTKSAYLRRLRNENPTPSAARSTDVSAPVRSAFPRSHARRNLTIPAPPRSFVTRTAPATRRAYRPAPPTTVRAPLVPRTVGVDRSLTSLSSPAVRPATSARAAPSRPTYRPTNRTSPRATRPVSSRTIRTTRVTPTARPARRSVKRGIPPPPPPPTMPTRAARKPLTVPPPPNTARGPTPVVRSLLQPVPGCADG